MPTVLHVISSLDRRAGGPPVVLAGLARAQARRGARVHVAATFADGADPSLADELRQAGVGVTLIGPAAGKLQRHPDLITALSPLIAAADVVHIHTLWEEIQHQSAVLARRIGRPYVVVPHGMLDPWSLSQSRWAKRAYLAWRLRRDLNGASFLHTLNADEARLIQPLGLRTRCEIIPNGIDPLEAPIDPPPRERVVLFLSRLHPKKGLDYLADAFAIVARRYPDVTLIVAGPDDGAERAFDARIAAAGLADRVKRVGPVYGPAKFDLLRRASVFVLPSRQEGFSVAIVEALACGTPVVISEQCHFPEVARDGAGNVTPLDAAAIAAAIGALLTDPSAHDSASRAARQLAQQYTWGAIAEQSLSLYPSRGGLAILANSMTPYRIALHQRLARELGLPIHSLFTDARSNAPWELQPPPAIRPVSFVHLPARHRTGAVLRWLNETRPSAVLVNGYNDWLRLRVLRWCRRNKIPALLWGDSNLRGDRAAGAKALLKQTIVRHAVGQASAVLACGSLGQAYFEKYGALPRQIFFMPYEPDYELIRTVSNDAIAAVRQRFGLAANRRRMVYSGRLIAIKRVDLLLGAFAAIAHDRANWDLLIVGDGPERAALQSSAAAGRVMFTGFIGDQETVSALYRSADVLVHPPDVEPWALVINEAAAAGLAIVASDVVGAAAELVRDGVNGRIFPAGDSAALRQALLDVTASADVDRYKAASASVLADWQRRGDPVNGLRQALVSVGITPEPVVD